MEQDTVSALRYPGSTGAQSVLRAHPGIGLDAGGKEGVDERNLTSTTHRLSQTFTF